MEFSLKLLEKALKKKIGEISGTDSEDRIYDSIKDLWKFELGPNTNASQSTHQSDWYTQAASYWENEANCPLSDDGVLGGYGKVTDVDVRDSNLFLDFLHDSRPQLGKMCACDCGAGIGRVSKHLLLPRFAHVDLVEQSPRLLASSAEYIGAVDAIRTDCIVAGLQEWIPETGRYDVIWIQWVIGHLWDADFVQFFRRCALALKSGGVIILKDNSAVSWTFVVDRSDRSVARCREYLDTLFSFAGLCIVSESKQTDFPEELYPVYMIALEPIP